MNFFLHKNTSASKLVTLHGKAKSSVQPKLTINTPGDQYEQEADAMAERVMRMSSNKTKKPVTSLIGASLQRKCAHCEEEKEEEKRRKPVMRKTEAGDSGMSVSSSFASSLNATKGGGSVLPQGTRSFMENAFSADFSAVRVHTDPNAAEMSKGINAKAFTTGHDIYFNEGQYNPNSNEGKHLLAHELTHTIQQESCLQNKAELYVQRADECGPGNHEIWGGIRIIGNCPFVLGVRADLNRLNTTTLGSTLLSWVTTNRSGFLTSYLTIQETSGTPGFFPVNAGRRIHYNLSYQNDDSCDTGSWRGVPNYVYLFHEIVHFWLFESGNGTDPERECMATGLGSYFTSMNYSENKLRCELGLPIRPCYGSDCNGLSVPACTAVP